MTQVTPILITRIQKGTNKINIYPRVHTGVVCSERVVSLNPFKGVIDVIHFSFVPHHFELEIVDIGVYLIEMGEVYEIVLADLKG